MPLYEYQCTQCGERVEILQKRDETYTHCPSCGGEMKKLISAPAIQFRGSGFYKTDYATAAQKSDAESKSEPKAETKSESKTETKSETKSETKPETKSEPKTKTESKATD